ncbi:hypothetical protein GT044_27005 [Streptomyces sp. SID335]|nr:MULTISPECIES: hypothetical protein [unclassified Streptomyces]MYY84860.1 hypothetical protein [Streptomyces sp. SID335]NDZ92029.1 hypothetical protein [Streptomyces sp. SID10115]NEA03652.1 hypothetical protein [Streptomyces sp. SID10116]NEB50345.1 hypothetical protein [Streptomyces sp. SID339]
MTLGLGLWGIRRDGTLWLDEMATYEASRRGIGELWLTLGNVDAVHGLYYLLMHVLFALTGDADRLLVLRIPSVLAMGVAAAGVALLGRRLAGVRAGACAGVVFALIPSVQRFAQEGRSYAAVCALVVWATCALVDAAGASGGWASQVDLMAAPRGRASQTDPMVTPGSRTAPVGPVATPGRRTRRVWLRYGVLMLVACLLHEFAVFALAGHALMVPRAARRRWIVAAVAVCAALAPLAVVSRRQHAQVAWLRFDSGMYAQTLVVCLLGAVCAVLLSRRAQGWAEPPTGLVRAALPLLVAPIALLMLLTPLKPLFVDRYVLYCWCGLALLVGGLIDRLLRGRTWHGAVAVVAAVAAVAALFPQSQHLRDAAHRSGNADATATARAVREAGLTGDAVVFLPRHHRGWMLPTPGIVAGLRDVALQRSPDASHTLYGVEASARVIRDRMAGEPRIVLVTGPSGGAAGSDGREAMKLSVIKSRFEKCRTVPNRGPRVTLYARPGRC